jgi:hypothetical protein
MCGVRLPILVKARVRAYLHLSEYLWQSATLVQHQCFVHVIVLKMSINDCGSVIDAFSKTLVELL